jgi:septal ring-binding cell division protein DamX
MVAERDNQTFRKQRTSALIVLANARVWESEGWQVMITDPEGQAFAPAQFAESLGPSFLPHFAAPLQRPEPAEVPSLAEPAMEEPADAAPEEEVAFDSDAVEAQAPEEASEEPALEEVPTEEVSLEAEADAVDAAPAEHDEEWHDEDDEIEPELDRPASVEAA